MATQQCGEASIRRVLVVDDSGLQRKILSGMLTKWGFDVATAADAEEALDLYQSHAPELVISDWMMPGMNGLELCREVRDRSSDRYCYFILLTSKSGKDEIARGLDAGSDDFLTKPVNPGELRARISAGDRILAMQNELAEKNDVISDTLDQLQTAYDRIDQDLIQARKIQQALVPERSRDYGKAQVSLLLKPCGHIGGDLVGMFSPAKDLVGFYSIDVSGHGITSALMTAQLSGYLSSRYPAQNIGITRDARGHAQLLDPAAVTKELNDRLNTNELTEEYFTMAYATADLTTGQIRLVQAGHPHPLLLRRGQPPEFVGVGGMPVGLLPGLSYEDVSFTMRPGDRLLIYTDGFTEALTKGGSMLDDAGLLRLIESCDTEAGGQEFLDDLFWQLTSEMGEGSGLQDDVSATLFEFKASGNLEAEY